MAVAKKKLLVSLAVGASMGVASLASLTSNPGTVKTADVTPKAPVVRSAPCPAGTIDTPTACVRQVRVPSPAAVAPATTTRTSTGTSTTYVAPQQQEQEPQEREAPEPPEPGEQGQGDENRSERSRG